MLSILAGFMIAVGAIVNLTMGPPLGPILFSIGLMTILFFNLELFTGKAGLLITNEIAPKKLCEIWLGNFVGCIGGTVVALSLPQRNQLVAAAANIIEIRNSNTMLENFILGMACGILMYVAVTGYKKTGNSIAFIFPVAVFIFSGYNHCVADMFYISLGANHILDFTSLIPTTIGNVAGCCGIPLAYLSSSSQQLSSLQFGQSTGIPNSTHQSGQ